MTHVEEKIQLRKQPCCTQLRGACCSSRAFSPGVAMSEPSLSAHMWLWLLQQLPTLTQVEELGGPCRALPCARYWHRHAPSLLT